MVGQSRSRGWLSMKFNSLEFLFLFLPIVMIGWRVWPKRWQRNTFILLASYLFYAFAAKWFALLMVVSTTVDFTVGIMLENEQRPGRRKLILLLSLFFNLGMLSFFKYFNFFIDSVNSLGTPDHPILRTALRIGLPAGISFYTFQSMGYSIDVYRRDLKAARSYLDFAAFVSLFPQLIAGPIVRPSLLLPQLEKHERPDNSRLAEGLFLFGCGLAKKVLIADRIAFYADPVLDSLPKHGSVEVWLAMVGFALQIYFDFSGYTDMARGLARMLGLEFSINFDSPYHARSPSEFWKRWHVSLSSWLRDYLYIPLGGNRKGERRTSFNLMATMLLGGLWHGAGFNFILWGGFHGFLLLVFHRIEKPWKKLPRVLQHALMVLLILFSWIPFRMHTMRDLGVFFHRVTRAPRMPHLPWQLWAYVALGAVICALPRNSNDIRWHQLRWPQVVALAALAVIAILHLNLSSKFLYFAF
jgi:alginate O-acetyltransferase complex protein AlgI